MTTGKTPLNDLGTGLYQGFMGGLYVGGTNVRPADHEMAGQSVVDQVQPRDAAGNIDLINGRIVLISIGISNTSQEFSSGGPGAFRGRAMTDASKNPRVAIVDCAQGGHTAFNWSNPNDSAWTVTDQRIGSAGFDPRQVQAAWVKLAELVGETPDTSFPAHAVWHQGNIAQTLRNLRARFPNLAIAYLSSRTRSYAPFGTSGNPEPIAYEENFAVQWLIESQIAGTGNLNYDPQRGPVVAPYLIWGPYIWTDGEVPRSDGLTWLCSDLMPDFTHPSESGVQKVGDQLIAFFKTDPLATPWFLRSSVVGQPPACTIDADVTSGPSPLVVNFNAQASDPDGTIVQYAWTFGDGGYSLSANPTKTYPVPGVYTVHLTVTDSAGNPVTASQTISVGSVAGTIPTVSEWGIIMMSMLLLTAGTLVIRSRPRMRISPAGCILMHHPARNALHDHAQRGRA